jgi:hypothetical protein
LNRGPASYSLLHQFNGNFSYQLPFGSGQHFASGSRGVVNQVIGGWQWNGIVTAQGGFPFTPLVGSNVSGTGDTNPSDVPDRNPNFSGPVVLGKPDQWFNPNAFLCGCFLSLATTSPSHICKRHSTNLMGNSRPMGDGWHMRRMKRAIQRSTSKQSQLAGASGRSRRQVATILDGVRMERSYIT